MSTLTYQNWTNVDASYSRAYQPGDRLVKGWTGDVDVDRDVDRDDGLAAVMAAAAEQVFARHNRDDRPDGRLCPSMSVGDVVQFGETMLSVDRFGWKAVTVDPADLITDRAWSQVV